MIWYNKDKTIMIDLTKIESFIFEEKAVCDKVYTEYIMKPKLSLNWDKVTLWDNDAKEVWEILKNKLKD